MVKCYANFTSLDTGESPSFSRLYQPHIACSVQDLEVSNGHGITSPFCFIESRFRCIPPGVVAKTRRRPTKPKVFAPSQAGASKPLFSTDKGAGSYSVPVPYLTRISTNQISDILDHYRFESHRFSHPRLMGHTLLFRFLCKIGPGVRNIQLLHFQ